MAPVEVTACGPPPEGDCSMDWVRRVDCVPGGSVLESSQELHRHVLGEPDVVGRAKELVPGLMHSGGFDDQDDGLATAAADFLGGGLVG